MSDTCNMCGLTTCLPTGPCDESVLAPRGLINASVEGSFDSTPGNGYGALDDGDRYTFSLCEFCLDWLFTQFKIPPRVTDYMHEAAEEARPGLIEQGIKPIPLGDPPKLTWRPATVRVQEDEWRRFKKESLDEIARRAKARAKMTGAT